MNAATGAMRAAVLAEPRRFKIAEVQRPVPGPGEVRIRLEGCGVCASNLPAFEGRDWFNYPLPPGDLGHEGWGVVDACGPGADRVEPGTRVAALSFRAYAEYDVARADAIATLPEKLDGVPFPGEAIGCAMNIFRRAQINGGQTVAIIGAGFLGALLTRLAAQTGAKVIAISRAPFSLAQARAMGAIETLTLDDHYRIIAEVERLTGGRWCERVIEATGKQWPLDLAGELTAFGGRLVIAGYHQDGPRSVNMQLWNWRGIDVINAHERDPAVAAAGLRAAVTAAADGTLDAQPLITHRFPLASIDAALKAARDRPDGFTKAVVLMDGGDGR
ncbi:MAG TPA: zinc-binding dehydrogenase [Gammaproteobacteria bacterium]|nr:zinc-binding dehydrogenase [Gammaproteobacteria bacterium]